MSCACACAGSRVILPLHEARGKDSWKEYNKCNLSWIEILDVSCMCIDSTVITYAALFKHDLSNVQLRLGQKKLRVRWRVRQSALGRCPPKNLSICRLPADFVIPDFSVNHQTTTLLFSSCVFCSFEDLLRLSAKARTSLSHRLSLPR